VPRASERGPDERVGDVLAANGSGSRLGELCSRSWLADLFLSGRCGRGTAAEGNTTALAMPVDMMASPPGDEVVGELSSVGDELLDSGDLGERVEVDWKSRSMFASGDVGVSGVELFNAPAAWSPFRVYFLCAKFPARSRNNSAPCSWPATGDWSAGAAMSEYWTRPLVPCGHLSTSQQCEGFQCCSIYPEAFPDRGVFGGHRCKRVATDVAVFRVTVARLGVRRMTAR
jgi:hypothetical protein